MITVWYLQGIGVYLALDVSLGDRLELLLIGKRLELLFGLCVSHSVFCQSNDALGES